MQKDLYPISEAQSKRLELTSEKLVAQCKDGAMALRQTIANTSLSQDDLAQSIGKQKRVLSRALGGGCGLPIDTLIRIMNESESVYLLQYMCKQMGGEFVFISEEDRELRELRDRVAILESRRAA